jgi:hypothetical protein
MVILSAKAAHLRSRVSQVTHLQHVAIFGKY